MLAEIQRRLPELEDWFVEWDCPVAGGCSMKRPDMLWEFLLPAFYFHIEIDENGNYHEDNRDRLREIQASMGTHRPGFVLRINPDGMLTKHQHADGEYKYTATRRFEERMGIITDFIREHIVAPMESMTLPRQCGGDLAALHVEKLFF